VKLSDLPLEAELAAIAERAEPGRTAQLAVRHWGWDGRGGATLEATGREFDITRERVRQLCDRLSKRLAADAAGGGAAAVPGAPGGQSAPALDKALVLAAHAAPTTAHALGRRLADERIAAQPFDPEGLLTAAMVLGREPTFSLETVKDVRAVLPDPPDPGSDTVAVIAAVVDASRAVVRRAGAARVGEITGRVAAELAVWVDDPFVTAVVSEPDDFVWLERRTGWFSLPSVAKNAVVSRIAKVLSLTGAVRLGDLHEGIRRDERMREFVMPEYILAELCGRLPGVRVVGDAVLAERPQAPGDVLERTELTLLRLLEEAGGEADRHELETACLGAGMKLSSFNNRIAYSPIVKDLGHGRYGLRGIREAGGPDLMHADRPVAAGDDVPRPGDLSSFRAPRRR
jgi:hypothetical protein